MGLTLEDSLATLGKEQAAERRRLEKERLEQLKHADKYVPIYELAKEQAAEEVPKKGEERQKKNKMRNDGSERKFVTANEIKKEAEGINNSPGLNGSSKKKQLKSASQRRKEANDRKANRGQKQSNGTPNGTSENTKTSSDESFLSNKLGKAYVSTPMPKSKGRKGIDLKVTDKGDITNADVLGNGFNKSAKSNGSNGTPKARKPGPVNPTIDFEDDDDEAEPQPSLLELMLRPLEEIDDSGEDEDFELDEEDMDGITGTDDVVKELSKILMVDQNGVVPNGVRTKFLQEEKEDSEEDTDVSVEDEDEIFGEVIDLQEDSDEVDDEDQMDEEDLDFIDDQEYEDDVSDDFESDQSGSDINAGSGVFEIDSDEDTPKKRKKNTSRVIISDDSEDKENIEDNMEVDTAEYDSNEDSDFNDEEESEEEEDYKPEAVDADEINDILTDACQDDEDEEEDESDSDDDFGFGQKMEEAEMENLHPIGLMNDHVEFTVADFKVTEPGPTCVVITKENNASWVPEKYELFKFSKDDDHSVNVAVNAFKWLIGPVDVQSFFKDIYSRRVMVVHRHTTNYYKNVFPIVNFYKMFQENFLEYGVNVNVAKYINGQRTTHNGQGRVAAGQVAQHFADGMSVQCVNPQSFDKNIHYICDVLQELFNCFVGANCYYTPKGSAGFAPHWDDIDAFLIQIEGRKHWTVHGPGTTDELWPNESSHNFSTEEMKEREENLVFKGWLEAGDILYLPRGYIHNAHTDPSQDSLHVTISLAQKFNYSSLMKTCLDKLWESQTFSIPQIRRNLPINIAEICGVADSNYDNEDQLLKKVETPLAVYMSQYDGGLTATLPSVVDDLMRLSVRRQLPPLLTPYEKLYSIHGEDGDVPKAVHFKESTEVRLIRKHAQRLLFQSEKEPFLVHRMQNSMVYEGRPETVLDLKPNWTTLFETLLKSYPDWISIKELGSHKKVTIELCQFLYNNGLLLVNNNVISKKRTMKCVVKRENGLIGVLKKTPTGKNSKQNVTIEMNDSEIRKTVTFSPQVKVKKIAKVTKNQERIIKFTKGKIQKKKNDKKTKNGNKKAANKFKKR